MSTVLIPALKTPTIRAIVRRMRGKFVICRKIRHFGLRIRTVPILTNSSEIAVFPCWSGWRSLKTKHKMSASFLSYLSPGEKKKNQTLSFLLIKSICSPLRDKIALMEKTFPWQLLSAKLCSCNRQKAPCDAFTMGQIVQLWGMGKRDQLVV